jgi:hypothetical protein
LHVLIEIGQGCHDCVGAEPKFLGDRSRGHATTGTLWWLLKLETTRASYLSTGLFTGVGHVSPVTDLRLDRHADTSTWIGFLINLERPDCNP